MKRENYKRATSAQAEMQRQAILGYLTEHSEARVIDLMDKLEMTEHACHNRLNTLRGLGLVRFEWSRGSCWWKLGEMVSIKYPKARMDQPEALPEIMQRWGGYRV